MIKAFTDNNKSIQWCPELGCDDYCFKPKKNQCKQYVMCECGNEFCFFCQQTSHKPLDCELSKKWHEKNESESENVNWIMAFSKPCPVCKTPIEKNSGCNHITCVNCKPYTHFCWVCLVHGDEVRTYSHRCNGYDPKANQDRENSAHEL